MTEPRPHSPHVFEEGIGKEIAESVTCSDVKNFCLYVTGIPPDFSQDSVRSLFSECGKVKKLNMLPPKQPSWPRVAFVEFGTMPEIVKALELYQCFQIGQYKLRASIAKGRSERQKLEKHNKSLSESLKGVDLGDYVEKSIEQSLEKAGKRFEKVKPVKKADKEDVAIKGKPCEVCKKLCLPTCGRCKAVHYCGSTCQREHWHEHKKVCPLLIRQHIGGKNVLASQNDSMENLMVEVDSRIVQSVETHMKTIGKTTPNPPAMEDKKPFHYPLEIQPGKSFPGILVDLLPPGTFYFQLKQNDTSVLYQLVQVMNEAYEQGNLSSPVKVRKGGLYACKFSADQQWYRACVQSISVDERLCKVWYIDFGNCEEVLSKNLRKLDEKFAKIAPHSLKAKLYRCNDIESSKIPSFILEHLKSPDVEIKVYDIKEDLVIAEMLGDFGEGKASLNRALLKLYGQQKKPDNEETIIPSSRDQDDENRANIQTEKKENPPTADELQSPNRGGIASKTSTCEEKHLVPLRPKLNPSAACKMKGNLSSIFQKSRILEERKETFVTDIPDVIVPAGLLETVITHVGSVENIWCTLLGRGPEKLQKMQNELSALCDENFFSESFDVDKICASKSSSGPGWYRAEMKKKITDDDILLLFIDYGNTETVKLKEICKMPRVKRFWQLERQGVNCKLKGCSPGTEKFNHECLGLLKQCENEAAFAEIDTTSSDRPYPITIYIDEISTVNEYISHLKQDFDRVAPKEIPEEPALDEDEVLKEKEENSKIENMKIQNFIVDFIKEGSRDKVLITHVESPENFTFQIFSKSMADLNDLSSKMFQFYDSTDTGEESFSIITGKLYAVKYDLDSMWYRAKVESRSCEADTFTVTFVDYGNLENVVETAIKPLPEQFRSVPIQGIKGKLYGCYPNRNGKWSEESVATIQSLQNQKLEASFREVTDQKDVVLDILIGDSQTLSEVLISAGYVDPLENSSNGIDVTRNVCGAEKDQDISDSDGCTEDLSPKNSESLPPLTANGKSDTDTPDSISDPNSDPGLTHQTRKNPGKSDPSVKDGNISNGTITKLKPKVGEVLPALVVHANSPSDFYCQVIDEDLPGVIQMLEELNVCCGQNGEECCNFSPGDHCAACASDGSWYRAKILRADEGVNERLVFYVDYGNEEAVPTKHLRSLSEKYLTMKSQAVHCSLGECFPCEGNWSKQCLEVMKAVVNQECQIVLQKPDGDSYLVDLILGDGILLSSYLIEQGLATKERKSEGDSSSSSKSSYSKPEGFGTLSIHGIGTREVVTEFAVPQLVCGEIIRIQLQKAVSPVNMRARVMQEGKTTFSIRCKMIGIEPADVNGNWTEEPSRTMMMFAAESLDARVIQEEEDDEGKIYTLQIPALVNALILAGQGLHCL